MNDDHDHDDNADADQQESLRRRDWTYTQGVPSPEDERYNHVPTSTIQQEEEKKEEDYEEEWKVLPSCALKI